MPLLEPESLSHGHYECRSLDETLPVFTDLLAVEVVRREDGAAVVSVGEGQTLRFTERDNAPPYDGHHIAIYVANFSRPHAALERHGAITEESNEHQYRFVNIFDPASGETLFELEHEVRSATHPMFMRELVNRDAAVTQATYARGGEALRVG